MKQRSRLLPALLLTFPLGLACGRVAPESATLDAPPGDEGGSQLTGMYSYMADAALFVDCSTGERFPVAMEADSLAMERAYLSVRSEPAELVLVTLTGRYEPRPPMEGDGEVTMLIPIRFGQFWPGEECPGPG